MLFRRVEIPSEELYEVLKHVTEYAYDEAEESATMHLTELVSCGIMALLKERSHVRHAKSGLH